MASKSGKGPGGGPPSGETVLATPRTDRLVMFIGFPLLGITAALCLPPLARWALSLGTGLPVRPVFWTLGSIDEPYKVIVSAALGALLGLGVALAASRNATKVAVTDDHVLFDAADRTRTVPRADVAAVFLDGKKLVVLDSQSRQLAAEVMETPRTAIAEAFGAHQFPWMDADPYAGLYRRWTQDTPDLPAEVNAVLAAREAALKKKAVREIGDLRDAVQKFGFVVREEGTQQYWRPLVRS